MGDVEEVVDHPRRRRPPHVDGRVDPSERRVVVLGDVRGSAPTGCRGTPTPGRSAPRSSYGIEMGARWRRNAFAGGRHAHAATLVAERPAVVGAREAAILDRAGRQRCLAVGAAIGCGERPRRTACATAPPARPSRVIGDRRGGDLDRAGDRLPRVGQRRRWSTGFAFTIATLPTLAGHRRAARREGW